MDSPGTFRLGTLSGVAIYLHWSFPLGGLLVAAPFYGNFAEAVYFIVGYLFLIAAHEVGHAVAARVVGLRVLSIYISGAGGLCSNEQPRSFAHAFIYASGGLLAQGVLFVATLFCLGRWGVPKNAFLASLIVTFTFINAIIMIANVIPGKISGGLVTDGAVIWRLIRAYRATRT